jgi:malate dehydrogenase (oxaloacetate-decarboxylating)(NADP+)
VNIEPDAEILADIALQTANFVRELGIRPRIAMVCFSNFGSAPHSEPQKVAEAVALVKQADPDLEIDGEMQADTAVHTDIMNKHFPFSRLRERANVLIFPDLQSANISYKLLQRLGGAEAVGPILMGMKQPVHVLQQGCEAKDIVYMSAIAVIDAQGSNTAVELAVTPSPAHEEKPAPV